jgi:phosphoglycolate phosphatase
MTPAPAARAGIRAVLFDLDGTFADTAPDLGGALNRQRARRGLSPLPLATIRPHASAGARGLLRIGFGLEPTHSEYASMREEFLALYEAALCDATCVFAGIGPLQAALEAQSVRWGIVTNKPQRYTLPLLAALGMDARAGCIVSGDTCTHAKPHPAPLLHAASLLGVDPAACAYVGDDERDVLASRGAGMLSVIAAWGYLGGRPYQEWNGEATITSPEALLGVLGLE